MAHVRWRALARCRGWNPARIRRVASICRGMRNLHAETGKYGRYARVQFWVPWLDYD
jgi:hypothetical protein